MNTEISIPEKYYQVIHSPVVSEKSTFIAEKNSQIAFRVSPGSSKCEIKKAVELLFKVKVDSVCVLNKKGKVKRFRNKSAARSCVRKAYVSLSEGYEINFAERVD